MWRHRLLARKQVEALLADLAGEHHLHRILGPVALTALGVGSVIGAGIFVTTGRAAAHDAGPAIVLSYCLAALGCALAALCYAEFASMVPVAGSAYTYAYAALGELFAWIIGWDLILEYAMACATVAAAWSGNLNELLSALGLPELPAQLAYDPFTRVVVDGVVVQPWFNLPAVLIVAATTAVLVIGIRESANTNALLVALKVAVVLFVIAAGASYVVPEHWTSIPVERRIIPADPASKWGILGLLGFDQWLTAIDNEVRSPFFPYGLSGVILGASIVFFAYIGFDAISTHAEEARHPQRDVPLAILITLGLCTFLYVAVALVITGMVPYPQIDDRAPLAAAFADRARQEQSGLLRAAAGIIAAGGLAGMTSVLLVTFLSQARIFLAMARDGLLPPLFREIHPRYRTPHRATMLTGGLITLVAAFTPILKLEEMVNIGTLMAFIVVCAAVLLLRRQRPNTPRPFRCPLVYLVAPAGMLVNLLLMLFLPWDTWLRLFVWLGLGLVFYFFYGYRQSVLGQQLWRELAEQGIGPTDAPIRR